MGVTKEKIEGFLQELKALYLKHLIFIGGCGCCESPFLVEGLTSVEKAEEYINHLRTTEITSREEDDEIEKTTEPPLSASRC